MMALKENEIQIGNWKFKLREISYLKVLSSSDEKMGVEFWVRNSVVTPENLDELLAQMSIKEGQALAAAVLKINGISGDFQKSQKDSQEQ